MLARVLELKNIPQWHLLPAFESLNCLVFSYAVDVKDIFLVKQIKFVVYLDFDHVDYT